MPKRPRSGDDDRQEESAVEVMQVARGRLKGALQEAIDPHEVTNHKTPHKNESRNKGSEFRTPGNKKNDDEEECSFSEKPERRSAKKRGISPAKSNSYVMKLFDRSVDLAQFDENTPLYPICRAWMANRPKNPLPDTKSIIPSDVEIKPENAVSLPPPEGPLISRIPSLLPEQETRCEISLNFDYDENPPPSRENLLKSHMTRWQSIRRKWYNQSILYEKRYEKTQEILNEMDTNL